MLTIDANIQMIAEQELADACEKYQRQARRSRRHGPEHRRRAGAGELADVQPAEPRRLRRDVRRNRALTDPYEPGSTIKPFIAGPGAGSGTSRAPTKSSTLARHRLHHAVRPARSPTCTATTSSRLWDVLVKSSNIGMSMLGERMGNDKPAQRAQQLAASASRTGIELPGEDPGPINPLTKWNKFSTESVSQGYELMVTPLQLVPGVLRLRERRPAGAAASDQGRARRRRQRRRTHISTRESNLLPAGDRPA